MTVLSTSKGVGVGDLNQEEPDNINNERRNHNRGSLNSALNIYSNPAPHSMQYASI